MRHYTRTGRAALEPRGRRLLLPIRRTSAVGPLSGALSGALAALALPPYGLWPLAFVALVPLARAVSGEPGKQAAGNDAARAGLAFGAVFYGLLLYWVPPTAHGLMPAGALSGVLAIVLLSATGGVQGVALRALLARKRVSPVLGLPLVWGGTEVALANAGPLAFPWTPLGLALAAVPEVAGIAEWIGPRGLTLWIAAVNGGAAAALVAFRAGRAQPRRAVLLLASTLLLAAVPAGWGVWRADRLPLRPLPSILVAQLQVPRDTLLDPAARDRAAAAALDGISDGRGASSAPAWALFPEAPFASPWGTEVEEQFAKLAGRLGVPVLVGAHWGDAADVDGRLRNAVLVVDPDGAVRSVHSKLRLVPGVERPALAAGPAGPAFEVGGIMVGALVCFEAAFDREARRRRAEGAELLVNPSNDGWFRPQGRVSAGAHAQHRAHLVLRAVETRAGAVRSSLGGELLVIAPTGRAILSRPPGGEGLLQVHPLTSTEATVFVRFGDLGVLGGLLLVGALAAGGARQRLAGMDSREGFAD